MRVVFTFFLPGENPDGIFSSAHAQSESITRSSLSKTPFRVCTVHNNGEIRTNTRMCICFYLFLEHLDGSSSSSQEKNKKPNSFLSFRLIGSSHGGLFKQKKFCEKFLLSLNEL